MITWSRLARMKLCPVFPGSWQCYKFFINYIMRLNFKSFMPTGPDPSFVPPGSSFAGTKFSLASTHLSGMKKLINTSVWKIPQKYISIDRRYFNCVFATHMTSICKKKVNKYLRSSNRRSSAKKLFLKILRYSQENTYVGVSLQVFTSAILLKRDTKAYVFQRILRNF